MTDSYLIRALIEAVLVGALCGLVGVHVVLRRLAFFTMGMTHATFPGIVLAALLGVPLYLGAGVFGLAVAGAVVVLTTRRGVDATSAVGVVLSAGFALGVVLLSAQSGFTRDLTAYLVGSLLTVQPADLAATGVALMVVAAVLLALHKELVLGAFDREALVAGGYPALALDFVVLLLVEMAVVTSVPAVGTILSVALIVAPAATARLWCDRIGTMTVFAVLYGIAVTVGGVAVSQMADVAAGGAVVLLATAGFLLSVLLSPDGALVGRLRRPGGEASGTPAADAVAVGSA